MIIYFLKNIILTTDLKTKNRQIQEEKMIEEKPEPLSDMPTPEGDKEVKGGKGLKILTPNKLLTSFQM